MTRIHGMLPGLITFGGDCLKGVIAALIEKLGICRCDIIAHSFGCRVALWLAANEPDLVNRLVLTGAAGIRKPQSKEAKRRSARFKALKKMCLAIERIKPLKPLAEKGIKALQNKFGSPDYNALNDEMKKTFVKVITEDLSPLLPRVKASTLAFLIVFLTMRNPKPSLRLAEFSP